MGLINIFNNIRSFIIIKRKLEIMLFKYAILALAVLCTINAAPLNKHKKREVIVDRNGFYLGGGSNNNIREASQIFDLGGPMVNPWINAYTQPHLRTPVALPVPVPLPAPLPVPAPAPVSAPAYPAPQAPVYPAPQAPVYPQQQVLGYQPTYKAPAGISPQVPQTVRQPLFSSPQSAQIAQAYPQPPQYPQYQPPQAPQYPAPQTPQYQAPQYPQSAPQMNQQPPMSQQPQMNNQQQMAQQPQMAQQQQMAQQPEMDRKITKPTYPKANSYPVKEYETEPFTAVFLPGQQTHFKLGKPTDFQH